MANFNIKTEAVKDISILGIKKDPVFVSDMGDILEITRSLKKQLDFILMQDNQYFIEMHYCKMPPKTKRFFIGEFEYLEDIPQRGIKTIITDNAINYILTYQLNSKQFNLIMDDVNLILMEVGDETLTKDTFDSFLSEIKIAINRIYLISIIKNIESININGPRLIRIYKMYDNTEERLKRIGIDTSKFDKETFTIVLTVEEYDNLRKSYPWIISGILENGTYQAESFDFEHYGEAEVEISEPSGIVGVIDSGFDLTGNISHYVTKHDVRQFGNFSDTEHGNMVTSLVVANDILNPSDPDGLGCFNVHHFELLEPMQENGPATTDYNYLINQIEIIISTNLQIKVWNLSFGANKTPWTTNVSALGMKLDIISKKYDVLFVVASGNERVELKNRSLNTPGDSLNALTVGSVVPNNSMRFPTVYASYSSYGSILHYEKPEVSHFGGPYNKSGNPLNSLDANVLISKIQGTSFSTPRVCRYAAWLISEGYTPLESKAKIISLASKETKGTKSSAFGVISPESTVDIKMELLLVDTKAKYVDIVIPDGTTKIALATSSLVNPVPSMGEEYSISNIELSLVEYNTLARHPEREKAMKTALVKEAKASNFASESFQRYLQGKYFTSKKSVYLMEKNNYKNMRQVAIRIRRQDLFNINKKTPLKLGVVVSFYGEINTNTFFRQNNTILEVAADTIVGA